MKLNSKSINYNVQTVDELVSLDGLEGDTVVVTDENRGGVFVYREDNVGTNNGGTIFNGWTRQYDGAVNVKWFGAKGDGVTDDTTNIQNALNISKFVFIPNGTYMIDAEISLCPTSNQKIHLDGNAVLKAITNSLTNYSVINIENTTNVCIFGGTILGERTTHTGSTGEWGMGINIIDSVDVTIKDISINDCWGDGIYIGTNINPNYSENITIDNVICDNNRRQGCSVVAGYNIKIVNSSFTNTNGTAPAAGIDVESDPTGFVQKVIIDNNYFYNNNSGVIVYRTAYTDADVIISNNIFDNDRQAAIWLRASKVSIIGNIIKKTDSVVGMNAMGLITAYGCSDVNITNNTIESNYSATGERGLIALWNGCTDFNISNNILKNSYHSAIGLFISNNVGYGDISNISINNNNIINCSIAGTETGVISIDYYSTHRFVNVNINNNNISDNRTSGKPSYVYYFSSDSNVYDIYNIDISNNTNTTGLTETNKIKFLNPYYSQQITSYNQTLTTGAWTLLPLTNNIISNGIVQTAYSQITVLKTGNYNVNLNCQFQNITQDNLLMQVNGLSVGIGTGQVPSASSQLMDTISGTFKFNAGDVISFLYYVTSSSTPYLRANSWLTIIKI